MTAIDSAVFLLGPLVVLAFMLFGVLAAIFWIWMLVDCLVNEASEGNDKLVWALVIVLLSGLGAILYVVVRRPRRIEELGR